MPSPGDEATTQYPTLPPTTAMPPIDPAAPGGPGFPTDPYDPFGPEEEEPTPWYKRPAAIAVLVIVFLLLAGLIAWLIFAGDDDDDVGPDSSRLIIELSDGTGQPVDRGMLATVVGPPGEETAFEWTEPDDAPDGATAGGPTGTDGRIDFEWEIDDEIVTDPSAWAATVTVTETIPAGWSTPGPTIECALQRPDGDDSVVAMDVRADSDDINIDRVTTYTFPNYQFRLGDTVTCSLVSDPPAVVDTTTVETTVVETTVVETTTTTSPPETTTTEAPATTQPAPPPTITVPPQPDATVWDVIANSPDLSAVRGWIEQAGLQSVFQDPDATVTFFAPTNAAIQAAITPSDIAATVNTHIVNGTTVLLIADLRDLAGTELDFVQQGPHEVTVSGDTVSIGGKQIVVTDVEASNGVIQVINGVLSPTL